MAIQLTTADEVRDQLRKIYPRCTWCNVGLKAETKGDLKRPPESKNLKAAIMDFAQDMARIRVWACPSCGERYIPMPRLVGVGGAENHGPGSDAQWTVD